jgi:hypothetical protein
MDTVILASVLKTSNKEKALTIQCPVHTHHWKETHFAGRDLVYLVDPFI